MDKIVLYYCGKQNANRDIDEKIDICTLNHLLPKLGLVPHFIKVGATRSGTKQDKGLMQGAAAAGKNSDNTQEKQTWHTLHNHWFLFL